MRAIVVASSRSVARAGFVALCACAVSAALVRADGESWIRSYDEPCEGLGWDEAGALAVSPSGDAYATGFSRATQYGNGDVVTARYDPSGALVWAARPDDPGIRSVPPTAIVIGAGGNVHVAGIAALDSENDFWVVTHDPEGKQLWTFRWDGPSHGQDEPRAVAVDPAGNIFLTGVSSNSDDFQFDIETLKVGPDGTLLWAARYGRTFERVYEEAGTVLVAAEDEPGGIVLDASGNVFVAGVSLPDDLGPSELVTIAYDRDGNELWARTLDVQAARPPRIAMDQAGDLVLAATSPVDTGGGTYATNLFVAKLAPDGSPAWARTTEIELGIQGPIAIDPSAGAGDVIATGYRARSGGEDSDLVVARLRPDGTTAWASSFDATSAHVEVGGAGYPWIGLGLDLSGNIAVACANVSKAIVRSLDREGAERWSADYPAPSDDQVIGRGLAVEAEGDLHVLFTRFSTYASGDMVVVRYGAGGRLEPESRWDSEGSGQEYARAVGVDGSGTAHVVGNAGGCEGNADMVALQYDAAGNPIRVSRFDASGGLEDVADAAAVDEAGNVHVTCLSKPDPAAEPWRRLTTLKLDPAGDLAWAAQYVRDGEEDLVLSTEIALDPSGNVLVGVVRRTPDEPPTDTVVSVLAYSPDGTPRWERDLPLGMHPGLAAGGITADAAGNVYVAAHATPAAQAAYDVKTVKIDGSGGIVWTATYDGPEGSTDVPRALALDPSGGVIVLAVTQLSTEWTVNTILEYDEGGAPGRTFRIDRIEERPMFLLAIAVDAAGDIYATGLWWVTGQLASLLTLKVDAHGDLAWEDRHDAFPGSSAGGRNIAVDPAGNVVVLGDAVTSGGLHGISTLRYRPDGQLDRAWVFGDESRDISPAGLAVGGDGGIAVVGSGFLGRPSSDIATLRYPGPGAAFVRGDANGDGEVGGGPTDAIFLLTYLFLSGDAPACLAACDADGSGEVEITDAIFVLVHQFLGGPPPGAPYPECGLDPDPTLDCAASTCGEGE